MKSIRRQLTAWLLTGLAVLWLAAGAGIYLAVRQGLLKSIDAELAVDARIVRFAIRGEESAAEKGSASHVGARRVRERMPAYDDKNSGVFYQMWSGEGEVVEKSASLGEMELEFLTDAGSDPVFRIARLADGRRVRTMSFRAAVGGRGKGKGKAKRGSGAAVTALGKDLSALNEALISLLGGIVIVGLLAGGGAVLLVGASLRVGLKPLRDLGRQTEMMDATSLDARFDATRAPLELQPVYLRLNDLITRLECSFERERRFSSDLAHEMRTPVAELKMLSEVALKWPDQAGADTHAEALEIACQLESMIGSLLMLARWESGEMNLEKEPIDLAVFLRECWEPFARIAGKKGIEVRFESEAPSAVLESDPGMLRHILNNLFSNAAEYTPAGGIVEITVLPEGIEVTNSAPDLREGDVAHLFERYWRADESRSDSWHSGLGLSLALNCAEALGLRLSAFLHGEMLHFILKKSEA